MLGLWRTIHVTEHEKALVYINGRQVRTLGAGKHRIATLLRRVTVSLFDIREQTITVPAQEILTRERVPVRVTLLATFQLVDPAAAEKRVQSWSTQVYFDLQLGLRELVAALSFDELLDQKTGLGERLRQSLAAPMLGFGVELRRVAIKDITMPATIRELMLKSVEAEKSAQASLIKAREEVAAARARANAARVIAENPAVLRLKELETLVELARSPNKTIVVALGGEASSTGRAIATGEASQ